MKKLFFTYLLFSTCVLLGAQTTKTDSLLNLLKTGNLTAKGQLDIYKDLCDEFLYNDTEKSIEYARKGLNIAEKEKDKLGASQFKEAIGKVYSTRGDYESALEYMENALALAIESADIDREASIYVSIAIVLSKQSKYAEELEYYMKALPLFEKSGNTKGYLKVLCNIGGVHRGLKNPTRAIHFLKRAETIAEKEKDLGSMVQVYFDLGAIYFGEGEYNKAIEYESKAIEICHQTGNKSFESVCKQVLATIYSEGLDENDTALKYVNESLELAEELKDQFLIFNGLGVLSNVYRKQGKYKESEEAAFKAWEMDSTNLNMGPNIAANIAVANIYLGNKEKAVEFFNKNNGLISKNTDKAYQESLMDLEVKYETEKKELQIEVLEKEKQLYVWLGAASIVILLLAIGLLFIRHRLITQKRELAEQQVKQLEKEKQLVAAYAALDGETAERKRIAIELHDRLGSKLSVVNSNLRKQLNELPDSSDIGMTLGILNESINDLRTIAHNLMPDSLRLYGLKVSLGDFCKAIKGADFKYFGDDVRLDQRLEEVIYNCAHELINNALKHADAQNIKVELMVDGENILLTVFDDGRSFDTENVTYGMGLENIKSKIAVYNGKMDITSTPGKGTEINIEIERLNR